MRGLENELAQRDAASANWTAIDRDYENLRIGMQALFQHLGIHPAPPRGKGSRASTNYLRS